MRILSPSDTGKKFRITSYDGEGADGRHLYNLVDIEKNEVVHHYATQREWLSGMDGGTALNFLKDGAVIWFEVGDKYNPRVWKFDPRNNPIKQL